jgi:hypothetical protein
LLWCIPALIVGVVLRALYGTWLAWREHKARQLNRLAAAPAAAAAKAD